MQRGLLVFSLLVVVALLALSSVGQAWARGLAQEATPTDTPTPTDTATPEPSLTPTPTATATVTPTPTPVIGYVEYRFATGPRLVIEAYVSGGDVLILIVLVAQFGMQAVSFLERRRRR